MSATVASRPPWMRPVRFRWWSSTSRPITGTDSRLEMYSGPIRSENALVSSGSKSSGTVTDLEPTLDNLEYVAEEAREQDGKVWVLETQTKGTGANMVPLDRVLKRSEQVEGFGFRMPAPREPAPATPRQPYRFKVRDVMTRQVLAEGVDAQGALEALDRVRSIVDVIVYVWDREAERWRMLTFDETRALWDRRTTARSRSQGPAAA